MNPAERTTARIVRLLDAERIRLGLDHEPFARDVLGIDPAAWVRLRKGNQKNLGTRILPGMAKNLPHIFVQLMTVGAEEYQHPETPIEVTQ